MEFFPSVQRRARCAPFGLAIQNLVVCVGLFRRARLSAFLWSPYSWLILGRVFWLRRYWALCFVYCGYCGSQFRRYDGLQLNF